MVILLHPNRNALYGSSFAKVGDATD